MIDPAKALAELEAVTVAFQWTLVRLGIKAIAEAMKLWRRMPANKAVEQADEYLKDAVHVVLTHRAESRALAVAYYRLARALRTGTTIPDPYDPIPKQVTLGELRREFARLTDSVDQPSEPPADAGAGATPTEDTPDNSKSSEGDSEVIPIEPLEGIDENGDADAAPIERDADQEARLVLKALGPSSLKRRTDEIDTTRPADEVDKLRDEAHTKAGARQAAAAARIVQNGARDTVHSLAERDKRVIGYVRVSKTGTPCGFCAMLISRGVIFYSSESSATYRADGEKYHDNCNCIAIPVYSMSDYEKSSTYARNREYSKLWPAVTRGLSGKKALSAWRRYFRNTRQTGDSDTGSALAA